MVRSEEGERIEREYEAYFGNEEWRKAWEQAKKDARKSLLAKVARMKAATEMHTKYKDLEERYKERIRSEKDDSDAKYFALITVNPEENSLKGYEFLRKAVEKCVSKKWVTGYAYTNEQRSADADEIIGSHIILIRGSKRPSELEREVRNTFKRVVGNPEVEINIQWGRKARLKDRIFRISGNRRGEEKDGNPKAPKTLVDKKMREILKLKDVYCDKASE